MSLCSNCKKQALPLWKKALVSPLTPIDCEACDEELTISWKQYFLAIIPGSLLFLLAYISFEEGTTKQYLGFAAGFVVMLTGQIYFMPFNEKNDNTNE